MKYEYLSETASIKVVSEAATEGVFEIEGLYTGYGITLGNALRRVLLSSLPGGAITQVKIKGASHEFSTIPGVVEDVVEILLNLKRIRFRVHDTEPQVLTIKVKGEREVTAADIETNEVVDLITPDSHIATISDKNTELELELTVEKGLGYSPVESRNSEKLPIGMVAVDAVFSPVTKVSFRVENMRVGDRTDYNRVRLFIETDGSITPSQAVRKASRILQDYFTKTSELPVTEPTLGVVSGEKTAKKKTAAPKKKTTKKASAKKESQE